MKIAVYETSDDVPEPLRAVAQFVVGGKFAPVFITASTKAEALARAQAFWDKYSDNLQRGVRKGKGWER